MNSASKICPVCGRRFTWRKKWRRDWPQVRYCSDACRRRRLNDTDAALERAIVSLLQKRGAGKTICPSEAARKVNPNGWRELMPSVRSAARRLAAAGTLEVIHNGRVLEPSTARGPIRLRLVATRS